MLPNVTFKILHKQVFQFLVEVPPLSLSLSLSLYPHRKMRRKFNKSSNGKCIIKGWKFERFVGLYHTNFV